MLKQCLNKFKGGIYMGRKTHHLVHNSNGGWDVKRGDSKKASAHANTKAEAEKIGRSIYKKYNISLLSDSFAEVIENLKEQGISLEDKIMPLDVSVGIID